MNELYCGYAMKKANRHLKRISVGKVKSISNLIEIIEQKY